MGWMGEFVGSAAAAFVRTKAKLNQQDQVGSTVQRLQGTTFRVLV